MTEHSVVFEKTPTGWSAYTPDLPCLGVAGTFYSETEEILREGIEFYIEDLRADGNLVLEPAARVMMLPISA